MNVPDDVLDRPVDVEARNTRPRFSGPDRGLNRRSRRARAKRCKGGSTTPRYERGWGGLFLNNRHYDPTAGVFTSVDPLVTVTGEPYIYGSANPVTYADPSGLCSSFSGTAEQWTCTFHNPDQTTIISGDEAATNECRASRPTGCNSPPPKPRPSAPQLTPVRDPTPEEIEGVYATGADLVADGHSVGACIAAEAAAVLGLNGSACVLATEEDVGLVATLGVSGGVAASVEGGLVYSNARSVDDLAGRGFCLSAGAGPGGGAVCSGLNSDGTPNGFVTVFAGVSGGLPFAGTLQRTWTETLRLFGTHLLNTKGPALNAMWNPDLRGL